MPSIKDVVGTNGSGPKTVPVEADLTQRYPLGNETIGAAMSIVGPRNPSEIARLLERGGILANGPSTTPHILRRQAQLLSRSSKWGRVLTTSHPNGS